MVKWALPLGLIAAALLMAAPFAVMLAASLVPTAWLNTGQGPLSVTLDAYQRLTALVPVGQYVWNSLLVATVTTAGQLVLSAWAGYALARLPVPGRTAVLFFCLATLMVPPQVNIVPLFLLMRDLGWMNSYWALIVPGLFSAYGVFLFRQWFQGLPGDLEDAARLDGCSPWGVFWRVAWPLARPAAVALGLLTFVNTWNSFLWPLVVTHSDGLRTLPVGIAALKGSYRDVLDWPVLMAASTVSTLPVLALFWLGQKPLMEAMVGGALKE